MAEKNKRLGTEEKLDKLEMLIRDKVEVMSGFAPDHGKLRFFVQLLKFYDKLESGYINYTDFYNLMLRFNFVGLTVEIEQLFNRYDVDMVGSVDYRDVAYRLYGLDSHQKLSLVDAQTMESLRRILSARNINSTVRFCNLVRTSSNLKAKGCMDLTIAHRFLTDESEGRIPWRNLSQLLDHYFNVVDGVDMISLVRDFKSGMQIDRKRLVRMVFDKLDTYQKGSVTSNQIRDVYRPPLDLVRAMFLPGMPHTAHEVLQVMQFPEKVSPSNNVPITWCAFLDYYRCLSIGMEDDNLFESFLRASWQMMKSPTTSPNTISHQFSLSSRSFDASVKNIDYNVRRIVVIHSDDSEEVIDVFDESSAGRVDFDTLCLLAKEKGVIDIADIRF